MNSFLLSSAVSILCFLTDCETLAVAYPRVSAEQVLYHSASSVMHV